MENECVFGLGYCPVLDWLESEREKVAQEAMVLASAQKDKGVLKEGMQMLSGLFSSVSSSSMSLAYFCQACPKARHAKAEDVKGSERGVS